MSWLNLERQKRSPKTIARRLTTLRNFAKWAKYGVVLEDYIAPTPGKTIPHPISEGLPGLERMMNAASNCQQEALVALGGLVGCRIGESISIRTDNFDLDEMMLSIRGKGDKTRVIPISALAWKHLSEAYVRAMFTPDHRLIQYQDRSARHVIKRLGEKANLSRPISSHDLRATFATLVLDHTENIRVVQELLGHSSVQTTEIYTGVAIASMRKAVQF